MKSLCVIYVRPKTRRCLDKRERAWRNRLKIIARGGSLRRRAMWERRKDYWDAKANLPRGCDF